MEFCGIEGELYAEDPRGFLDNLLHLHVGDRASGMGGGDHLADLRGPLRGGEVPSEGKKVTPVSVFLKEVCHGIWVSGGRGSGKCVQPLGGHGVNVGRSCGHEDSLGTFCALNHKTVAMGVRLHEPCGMCPRVTGAT